MTTQSASAGDPMARVRRVGATVIPALAVLAVQLIFFPMPFGVVPQGVIVGLLGALMAVGMALIYRANRVLNFAQVQLGLAPTVLAVSLTRTPFRRTTRRRDS